MSYFVLCTFDLKNASRQDYENAYADLANLGLRRVVVSDSNTNFVIPTTTVAGTFNGPTAAAISQDISNRVQSAFQARRLSSEIFVAVGGDWAWSGRTT
jgi:hypothetical protein